MKTTKFEDKVLIGSYDGEEEYLAPPSWDCDWYWGFGYLQNKDIHHHVNTIDKNKNLFDSLKEYYNDSLVLKDKELWTFCELMATFYTLKETAEVLGRGGSHYTTNPISKKILNKKEVKRINEEILPLLFDEVNKLFKNK